MEIALRAARPADAEEMAGWFADLEDLARWGGPKVRFPLTADQLAAWLAEPDRISFTAVDENDRPTGHVQFKHDPEKHWARLGRFGIARRLRGQGYGRALFEHAVRYAFTELDVEHLVLAVVPGNDIARKLYLSCGFREEDTVERSWTVAGKAYEMNLMGLIRSDWLREAGRPTHSTRVA